MVNLDKLTYAGNPANLAELSDDERYVFARGDINDAELVSDLLQRHSRRQSFILPRKAMWTLHP